MTKKCPACSSPVGVKKMIGLTILGRSVICNSCQRNLWFESKIILDIALFVSATAAIYFYESQSLLILLLVVSLILVFLYFLTGMLKSNSSSTSSNKV